jgi:hypothetical protein
MKYPQTIEKELSERFSQKIAFFEYMYIFILIIYAGRANIYVNYNSIKDSPFWVLLPVVLSGILAIRWKIKFDGRFYILMLGFAIYFIAISLKYREIQPTYLLRYLFLFFIVYSAIKALKLDLFKIYEYLLYYLAIVGLIMWVIQIVLGVDTLYYYLSKISLIDEFSYVSGNGLSALIYSVQPSYIAFRYNFTIPRNCGYAWEPGAFAVFLCLAIFINLFFSNSENKGQKRFWVLGMALLTSQSTTGYFIFIIIILFYLFNKKLNILLLVLPFVVVLLIYMTTLPFMSQKVIGLIDETKGANQLVESSIGEDEEISPQRFTSFVIRFTDFINNPILGLGAHNEETWTNKIGANISAITGIGDLLSEFGIIGFLFFIILSLKTSFLFSKYYKYNGQFLLFIIILFISISYSILFLPLVMCFWMFHFFEPRITIVNEKKKVIINP